MLEPNTPAREQSGLLDIFRLALAVHLVAESRVLASLVSIVRPPTALRLQIAALRTEHIAQQVAAECLATHTPASDEWYTGVLELRVLVLDHAKREDYLRAALEDHVPATISRGLVAQYATERMRMLATTSPLAVASQVRLYA
ncbi:MAG TPA: hypothetical protein VIV11_13725 [Kofleriaceae bacterium]